ncbi:13287_t:CDS:1 [Dentiscutata erythropus]|uniref:13287_t:CDS:1 n=1 Tax=Dentiscutata erythropus TaxID=1348616 RepID=A0A9N8VY21_9GLOM|nr:13287_t:CDS:1 [Dentiscutata erythropus]
MQHDLFEETVEEKVFGDFSFDQFPFFGKNDFSIFEKNKYDGIDIRELTCKHLVEEFKQLGQKELDTDKALGGIINKTSAIFEGHIINTFDNINTNNEEDISENHIISYLTSDIDKLAKLYAAFSTEIINCVNYGMIDLRPYKLAGINTSVLNAGIFSRAGNQIRLSHIINHMALIQNHDNFIEEYNKRIHNSKVADTFNIMITSIASHLTPFGANNVTFKETKLDKNMSFAQLLYRNIGGDDMTKQHASDRFDPAILPSLTELHRNTIEIVPLECPELVFRFEKGKLTITKLYIHPHWIETLWNLVMLEMRSKCEPIVSTIICFYSGVLKNEKDFHLAYQLGMVYSGPVTYTQFYEILCKISEVSHYNSTLEGKENVENLVSAVKKLQKNSLLQLYILSGENVLLRLINISAIVILLLTMVQTIITVLAYKVQMNQCNQCEQ